MIREIKILKHHGKQYINDLRNQAVSEKFRGRPEIEASISRSEIEMIHSVCPSGAIDESTGSIDMGRCVFCRECEFILPAKVRFHNDYRIAVNRREDLVIKPGNSNPVRLNENKIRKEIRALYRKSLKLRQVSAGGDNSCEMELNASGNVNFDFGRYGVEFVASPRHADGIHVTGPISRNMKAALLSTYEATPAPKVVIAVGSCALSGGPFRGSPEVAEGLDSLLPVDLFIPGCPPHPLTNLHALLNFFK